MVKHHLLVEKDRGNACRKNQEKKTSRFCFGEFFLEVSVFTALTVFGTAQHFTTFNDDSITCLFFGQVISIIVPDHDGGRKK